MKINYIKIIIDNYMSIIILFFEKLFRKTAKMLRKHINFVKNY